MPQESTPAQTVTEISDSRSGALRAEIQQAGLEYHALLRSLTVEELRRTSGNPVWTVGELMWHMAWNVGFVPSGVERARKGKSFSPPS